MSAASSILSQTLQGITTTKVRELGKQRQWYENKKSGVLQVAREVNDQWHRIGTLVKGLEQLTRAGTGLEKLWLTDSGESVLKTTLRYLQQAKYDPSVSEEILDKIETDLKTRLNQQTNQYDFADLYSKLLLEWSNPNAPPIGEAPTTASGSLNGDFEVVEKDRLQALRDKFSDVVFNAIDIDQIELDAYMASFFEDEKAGQVLEYLRNDIRAFAKRQWTLSTPFDADSLDWCIGALLRNDLLNDEQKSTLEDININNVVRDEICDVLNMRYADIENWSWDAPEGMFYEPRRQLNGKYRIMMDEEILSAIFTHYIGTIWAVKFKASFTSLTYNKSVWKGAARMPTAEQNRQNYFLGGKGSVQVYGGRRANSREQFSQ